MKSEPKHKIIHILQDHKISDISMHSDYIKSGCAFFATTLNPDYIKKAIKSGAKCIISEEKISDMPKGVENIVISKIHKAIKAASLYLYKEKPEYIVGVTGTSGKSSVVDYIRQICSFAGLKSASIGTMGIICSDKKLEERANKEFGHDMTTPNLILLHQIMNFLAKGGVTHLAFEVSSHALDQDRIGGISLSSAIFTNLSQDHLDYHQTLDHYKRSKLKIFSDYLKEGGQAILSDKLYRDSVIKTDLLRSDIMKENDNLILVGINDYVDFKISDVKPSLEGQKLSFRYLGKEHEVRLNMVGTFQSMNLLMALAAAISVGVEFDKVLDSLPKVKSVTGRLDKITDQAHPYHIFTDYAHKPEALEFCLKELKMLCKSRLFVVFGCGGNRDKGKRKIMGESAAKFADIAIITDDNPRLEDPALIRKDVLEGASNAIEIGKRDEAIKQAIGMLESGDVLLIAGKGHEHYMDIGGKKVYFNDEEEVRKHI